VQDAHRLLLMNLMLHGIEGDVRSEILLRQMTVLTNLLVMNPPLASKKGK